MSLYKMLAIFLALNNIYLLKEILGIDNINIVDFDHVVVEYNIDV